MTPSEARAYAETLPEPQKTGVLSCFRGIWDDGFGVGTAKLPRKNPFESAPEPVPDTEKHGKKR